MAFALVVLAGVAAAGAVYGGIEGKAAADKNAANANQAAQEEQMRAQLNIEQQQRTNAYKEGAQVAAYGGSGVAMTGSPLDELASQKISDNFEAQVQYFNGEVSANADTADAAYQQTIGNAQLISGVAQGASSLSSFLVQLKGPPGGSGSGSNG